MVSEVYSKNIVFPNRFIVEDKEDKSPNLKKVIIEPLQYGFGVTIGNVLRRVLLSSIRGIAIDSIKIPNITHEYTTIDGVVQNVAEIIYNLKRVIFQTNKESVVLYLKAKGKKKVYASDITLENGVEIINKDHFLFEITDDVEVNIEISLCSGIGDYVAKQDDKNEFGRIFLDKHFSPILNVAYKVLPVMIDGKSNFEKLVMDIKTDGSIKVEEAVKVSLSILMNFLKCVDNSIYEIGNKCSKNNEKGSLKTNINYNLYRSINDLELSVRSQNCLRNEHIEFLGDLVVKKEEDMMSTPNFGKKSLNELKDILEKYDLSFGMKIDWRGDNFVKLLEEAREFFSDED